MIQSGQAPLARCSWSDHPFYGTSGVIRFGASRTSVRRSGVSRWAATRSGVDQNMQNGDVPITRPCATHGVFLCPRYGVDRSIGGTPEPWPTIDSPVCPVYGSTTFQRKMRSFLAALLLLGPASDPAAAAIFTVQPGTTFYSEPKQSEQFQLKLPEVRVEVPPMQDARGFCRFKLVYKIADRDNPDLPKTAWARCVVTDRFISK